MKSIFHYKIILLFLILIFLMINADTSTGATSFPDTTQSEIQLSESPTTSEIEPQVLQEIQLSEPIQEDSALAKEEDLSTRATTYPETGQTTKTTKVTPAEIELSQLSETTESLPETVPSIDEIITLDKEEKSIKPEAAIDQMTQMPEKIRQTIPDTPTSATDYVEGIRKDDFVIEEDIRIEKKEEIEAKLKEDLDLSQFTLVVEEERAIELEVDEDSLVKIDEDLEKEIIIFSNEDDSLIPPSYRYDYYEDTIRTLKTDYQLAGFVPENSQDFFLAEPHYKFDSNEVVLNSELTINSDLGKKLYNHAYLYLKKNQIQNAIHILKKLIHYNYNLVQSYHLLGLCYLETKKYLQSINYLKKANLFLPPSRNDLKASYLDKIGNLYYQIEDFQNAIRYFKQSLQFQEQNYIYNKLGMIYYLIGNFNQALSYWKNGSQKGDLDSKENYNWLLSRIKK
ncbi:MAG: tetratricopeptide repeat protein [Spirochaetes bacterium]|nr:tetratricopeptide repeat protein [Spirochaetota bacterium]